MTPDMAVSARVKCPILQSHKFTPHLVKNCYVEVLVCQYQNCLAQGSAEVLAAFLSHPVPGVTAIGAECQGQCNLGVTVRVLPDETWYCRVKPEQVKDIVEQHLKQGMPVKSLLHPRFHPSF